MVSPQSQSIITNTWMKPLMGFRGTDALWTTSSSVIMIPPNTHHVRQFLQCCVKKKITLTVAKCRFAQPSVTFTGLYLSLAGYHMDPSIFKSIVDFPTLTDRTTLQSFMGLVNQLSSTTSTVATLTSPLCPLLQTRNEFVWSEEFKDAFKAIKESLTSTPTLAYLDPTKPTHLCTDVSRQGLGFVLQQQRGDDWPTIQAGSRFLSDAESHYAIIELELLAVAWAFKKSTSFLQACHTLPSSLTITLSSRS